MSLQSQWQVAFPADRAPQHLMVCEAQGMSREVRMVQERTREFISAKFLLSPKPEGYVIPPGFVITQCPVKVCRGVRHPKGGVRPGSVWK